MRHDNAADAISDVWICVEDPDNVAARYARYTDRPVGRHGHTRVLTLDRAALIFTSADTAHQTMPTSRCQRRRSSPESLSPAPTSRSPTGRSPKPTRPRSSKVPN